MRALHANAIKVYRGGEVDGTLLAKEGDDTRREATLNPGDLD